ncbi:hypothetical protein XENOCAPTIV_024300, partial [Xenoophorus captivus]
MVLSRLVKILLHEVFCIFYLTKNKRFCAICDFLYTGESSSDLIRHFLIESSAKGVRIRGSSQEPYFGSLSALVYQHTISAYALPCRLLLNYQ